MKRTNPPKQNKIKKEKVSKKKNNIDTNKTKKHKTARQKRNVLKRLRKSSYTDSEWEVILTIKERLFCNAYVLHWNGALAAREAGYVTNSATMAWKLKKKWYIKLYLKHISTNYEQLLGFSKARQLKEYLSIAYSNIVHLHNTWITLKEFEHLTDQEKRCIESIDTKTETKQMQSGDVVEIKYIKIKLYNKLEALKSIDKLMGYNSPEKTEIDANVNGTVVILPSNKRK